MYRKTERWCFDLSPAHTYFVKTNGFFIEAKRLKTNIGDNRF